MTENSFDTITKLFASRRISRRQAVKGAAGITASGLAATGLSDHSKGAGSIPVPDRALPEKGQTLFVQTYQQGSIDPKKGEAGTWTLTLEQGLGQTSLFPPDRPERSVGIAPSEQFIAALGFPAGNPPNAALVFENDSGNVDITVVELFNPTYDTTTEYSTVRNPVARRVRATRPDSYRSGPPNRLTRTRHLAQPISSLTIVPTGH